jgi:hypothetical protein
VWSDALGGEWDAKGTRFHDLNTRDTIPDHFGQQLHSRGVVSRTSTYLAITPYISVDKDSRRRMPTD